MQTSSTSRKTLVSPGSLVSHVKITSGTRPRLSLRPINLNAAYFLHKQLLCRLCKLMADDGLMASLLMVGGGTCLPASSSYYY